MNVELLLQTLTGLELWAIYAVVGILVFGESAAVVAVFLPGELALLAGGAVAARGPASVWMVLAVGVVAAICGHAAGYEIGRRHGLRVLRWPLLRRRASAVAGVADMVARRGGPAVFLGRWTNVTRILVPLLVGTGRMPYRTFTLYNVLGGVAWVVTFVLLGTAAGASLDAVQRIAGQASWGLTAVAVVAGVGGWLWWRMHGKKRRRRPQRTVERKAVRITATPTSRSRPGRAA